VDNSCERSTILKSCADRAPLRRGLVAS
jgi:hypothetical protein